MYMYRVKKDVIYNYINIAYTIVYHYTLLLTSAHIRI